MITKKLFTAAMVFLALSADLSAETDPEPANQVAIVIDGSGSYKSRQEEAVIRAVGMLTKMSETRLQRWETGTDRIFIIALDALPEIIWEGSLKELKTIPADEWTERFKARKDLSLCTDVTAAFSLAASRLDGDPRFVSKYLFVFSDLIDEPPTTSVRQCERPMPAPTEAFPWESLTDVSVAVFWVPPNQKLIWRRAIEKKGLQENFALYSASESGAVKIAPPPRPTVETTEEDQKEIRAEVSGAISNLFKWALVAVGAMIALIFLLLAAGLLLRRRTPRRVLHRIQPLAIVPGRLGPPVGQARPVRRLPPKPRQKQ